MDNRSIFLYQMCFEKGDGEGYPGQMWVTGASVRGVERWRKHLELRREYELLRLRSW